MSDAFSNLFHNNNAVQGERFIAKPPGAEYPMMHSGKPPLPWGQYEPDIESGSAEAIAEDVRKNKLLGSPADQAFIQQMQKQPEGSQITDPAWIGASKRLYHYMNPKSPPAPEVETPSGVIDIYPGGNPRALQLGPAPAPGAGFTDEDYANWGVNFMSKFNYNITAMLIDVNKLSGAPSEVAASMYYMMETADRDGMLLENFTRGFSNFMTDPTTYVGLSTLGIGMVGSQSGKQLSSMAFKEVLKNIVMNRGGAAGMVVGAESMAYSGIDNAARQGVKINAGQQDEANVGETALSLAAGFVLGNRLSAALPGGIEVVKRGAGVVKDVVSNLDVSGTVYSNPVFALFDAAKKAYEAAPNDPKLKAAFLSARRDRDAAIESGEVDTSYRMQHEAGGPDGAARLDDMTKGGEVYPDDFYGPNGLKYYGNANSPVDQESYQIIQEVAGDPDATVTIYRAVPDDDDISTINPGDFVSLSRAYAEDHGSTGYGSDGQSPGKVIEMDVRVSDLYNDGNSINEFGYFPDVQTSSVTNNNEALTSTVATPGKAIPQSAAPPTPEALAEAQADVRQGADIVGERLPVIVPEAERVNGGSYVSGAPGGGAWTDLPPADLAARGGGLQATDADLEALWQQTLSEVSQAGRDAVARSGATWSAFSADMWDKALRLPARSQLWYELSGESFVRRLPNLKLREHMMFLDLIGATSARAEPGVNLERSLAVLSQELRGVPIDVDLTITSTVEDALQRQGDGVSSDLANKTGMFSDTLALTAGLPVQYPISVNDVWVGKAFGISDSELSANQALHEVFGKYMNKLRETVNAEGNSAIPHESWHLQARQWVEMRATDKGIDTSAATLNVEGNDYAGEFVGVVEKLEAAGIQVPGGIITRDILMNPGFADALRATTPAFRNAPKATVEFGTLLTPAGEEGAALYQRARETGDKLTQQEYLSTLTSSMFHSGRGKSTIWEETVRLATNTSDKVTRIVSPTSDDPFAISGTFEGAAAPNIRVPLKDMSPEQIAYFNAMAGQGLKQKAMAAAEIKPLSIGEELPEGYVETASMLFNWTEKVPEEMLTGIANALGEGFEISVAKYPNGLKVDINPRFGDAGPEGPSDDALEAVADYLENTYNVEGGETFRAAYKSEYGQNYVEDDGTGAAYLEIIENTLKGWNDEGTNQVIELGVPEAIARQFINGDIDAIPKLDGKTSTQMVSIKGKARTVQKRLRARVNTHNEKLTAWQELGNGLDAKMQSQLAKWTKRLDTAAKKAASNKGGSE